MNADQVLESNEEAIIYEELDFAYLGLARMAPYNTYAAYDLNLVLEWLCKNKNINMFDAEDYVNKHYNCGGEGPVFVVLTDDEEEMLKLNKEAITPDDADDVYLGYAFKLGHPNVAVIDYYKNIEIIAAGIDPKTLSEDETAEDIAIEYLEYNATCAYVGEQTPFYLEKYTEFYGD